MLFFLFYAYRSLLARLRANMMSMLAVALFVTGGSLGLAYYLAVKEIVVAAPPENIIVVNKSASTEVDSKLDLESARKVLVLDGIATQNGVRLAARELVSEMFLERTDYDHFEKATPIRGLDETSFAVHRAKLVSGSMMAPGSFDILVGRRLAKSHPHLAVGAQLAMPAGPGKIVGIFATGGGPMEDEIWTLRPALELHSKLKHSSSVTLVAADVARVPDTVASINANRDIDARAATVADFRAENAGLATIARTVMIMLILLSIVATFVISTTFNAAVLVRMPELGAMAAIGIRRGVLGRVVLVESLLLGFAGAVIGVIASEIIANVMDAIPLGANPVELSLPPIVPIVGLALGVIVGLIGGIVPAFRVRRLNILEALR